MILQGYKKITNGNQKAFTLVEVVISVVILSMLAIGILSTVSFGKRAALQAEQKIVAVNRVQSLLDTFRNMGSNQISAPDSVDPSKLDAKIITDPSPCTALAKQSPYCMNLSEFNGRMKGVVVVHVPTTAVMGNLRQILVTARWVDFTTTNNRIRTESAVTMVGTP